MCISLIYNNAIQFVFAALLAVAFAAAVPEPEALPEARAAPAPRALPGPAPGPAPQFVYTVPYAYYGVSPYAVYY